MNVELILVREEHLPQLMEWRMRPDITKYLNTDPKLTLPGQKEWYARIKEDPSRRDWVICVDGVVSGSMGISAIDRVNSRCNWGWYIGNLAVRSLKLAMYLEWNLCDYVFGVLKLHKLCNETFVENKQVVMLHRMCGSHEDGVLRQHICKNGVFYDVSYGSILAGEWEEKRKEISFEQFYFE